MTANSVIGWHTSKGWFDNYVETASDIDIHFTYPLDGNYHISYKYFDENEGVRIEKRVFFNEIRTKKFDKENGVFLGIDIVERNDDFNDIKTFVYPEKAPKLTEIEEIFGVFSIIAFPSLDIQPIHSLFNRTELLIQPKPDDIVLGITEYPEKGINIGSFVLNKDYGEVYTSNQLKRISRREINEYFGIELFVLVIL